MSGARFQKKTTAELLADAIEAQLRDEGCKGLIPSGRDLARRHQVSLPTVQKALAMLIRKGVLLGRGGKRRHAVSAGLATASSAAGHRIIVLSGDPLAAYDVTVALGIQRFGELLRAEGHAFRFVDLSTTEGAGRRKAVREALMAFAPTHAVLMKPDRDTYRLTAKMGARIATMYSQLKVRRPFGLGIRYGYLADIAFERLRRLGHRRIFMPFIGRKLKLRSLAEGITRAAKVHEVDVRFVQSAVERTPANLEPLLTKALRAGATAIVFPQWADFLPAVGYFAREGLEFPRDLSVVALVGTAFSKTHVPPIAGCQSSPESLAQQALAWVRSGKLVDDAYRQVYERTWMDGGSIGPPPRKG